MKELTPYTIEIIDRQARKVCRKFGYSDWEDIAQSVKLEVWEKAQKGQLDDITEGTPLFYSVISKYTAARLNKELAAYMYFKGAYLYPRPAILALLDKLAWGETPESLSLVETRVDIHRAYDRLSDNYKLALFSRYALGVVPEPSSAERRTLSRAVDRFMDFLNFISAVEQVNVEDIDENDT